MDILTLQLGGGDGMGVGRRNETQDLKKKKKAYPCIVKRGFKVQGIILQEDNLVFPSDIAAKALTTESGEEVGKRN